MGFHIVRNDITEMYVDAIVNTANPTVDHGCGTDSGIYKAAGPKLEQARREIGEIGPGQARGTPGYRMTCKYILHTVATMWKGGSYGEAEILADCYRNALLLGLEKHCHSIAFPLIGTGFYQFPRSVALKIAINECTDFLIDYAQWELDIYLVVFDRESADLARVVVGRFPQRIDDYKADCVCAREYKSHWDRRPYLKNMLSDERGGDVLGGGALTLEDILSEKMAREKMPFQEKLRALMDSKGMDRSDVYKEGCILRSTFQNYYSGGKKPKKRNALKIAVAMRLDYEEAMELLESAGVALDENDPEDQIFMECFRKRFYDTQQIDTALENRNLKTYFSEK